MNEIISKAKGSFIYLNNQPVTEVSLLLSGKVTVVRGNSSFTAGPGELVGLFDLLNENYEYSYLAAEDVKLLPIQAASPEAFEDVINSNKTMRGSIVMALAKYCTYLSMQYNKLFNAAMSASSFIKDKQNLYLVICKNNLLSAVNFNELSNEFLSLPSEDTPTEIIEYYNSLSRTDKAVSDSFFAESSYISSYHFNEAYELSRDFFARIRETSQKISSMHDFLLGTGDNTLFRLFVNLYISLKDAQKDTSLVIKCLNSLITYAKQIGVNSTLLANASAILTGLCDNSNTKDDAASKEENAREFEKFKEATTNALDKLLSYSDLSKDITDPFMDAILAFRALKNKNASTDNVIAIRKTITKYFYPIYEAIFFKYAETGSKNKLIELFLNTCFVDETLVSDTQLEELFNLDLSSHNCNFKVYTMYEWLLAIFKGEQEPSRNEFDMDYNAMVRERKRTEKLNDAQVSVLLNDKKAKTRFEIQNFFRSTHRITCGQIIGFCPILYNEYADEHFSGMFVSKEHISDIFSMYSELDFSCFYRIVPYEINKYGLSREYLQTKITPYIILNPIIGQKGIMWQEISGAKRDTPARFSYPIFFRGDLNTVVLNTLGQYRWELCKSIEGLHWNDLQQPSLTAEFYDYLSFYKKNPALSSEAKEKIKTLLTKCHNNMRDVFANDYVTYMQYESTGASRLNRLSRAILFKYCPFDANTRKNLLTSPNFKDLIDNHAKNCTTKLRRINSVINLITNGGGTIPPEFEINRDFYSL